MNSRGKLHLHLLFFAKVYVQILTRRGIGQASCPGVLRRHFAGELLQRRDARQQLLVQVAADVRVVPDDHRRDEDEEDLGWIGANVEKNHFPDSSAFELFSLREICTFSTAVKNFFEKMPHFR
jgi:hypothetical protein